MRINRTDISMDVSDEMMARKAIAMVVVINNSTCLIVKSFGNPIS